MPTSRRRDRRWLGAFLTLLAAPALAQDAGSLRGAVRDSSGALVPGAAVTLVNEATRFTREIVTDAAGSFYFAAVNPGEYSVRVAVQGFRTAERRGVRISQREAAGIDFALQLGAQTERLEVTAERGLVQTETGAREGLVTADQIDSLSIVGRSPVELLRILPGTVMPDVAEFETVGNATGASNTNQYAQFTVNGVRGSSTVVTLDGSRLTDFGGNSGVIVVPNNEMVSEVKVQASNYAAEFGSAGIQVNAMTKGGSARFHGTAYDYLRDDQLQANDRSNTLNGVPRPKSRFQYPGGNLSGPILVPGTDFNANRDKAFFFFAAEWQRQVLDSGSNLAVTPSDAMRNGDFSELLSGTGSNLGQPAAVLIPGGYPGAGTPAPNNDLRPYVDPFGRALLSLYPAANYRDPDNRYNYVYNAPDSQNRLQLVLRLDYSFSDSTRAYVRLAQDGETLEKARGAWWNASEYPLPSAILHENRGRSLSASLTSVLSPESTNELLFSFSKLWLDVTHEDPRAASLSRLGFPEFHGPWGQQSSVIPEIRSNDPAGGSLNDILANDFYADNSSLLLSDTFTRVLGTHALKAGASLERGRKDQNAWNSENVALDYATWGNGSTGDPFADVLVARPADAVAGTPSFHGRYEFWNLDFFVQDSWKVRRNLTLEYGLRFSKMTNNVERGGHAARFEPSLYDPARGSFTDETKTYMNGVAYAELAEIDDGVVPGRPLYVLPRLNFVYDVKGDGDLILRGGGGVFRNRPMGNAEYGVAGFAPYSYQVTLYSFGFPGILDYSSVGTVDPFGFVGGVGIPKSMSTKSVDYPRYVTTSLSLGKRLPWSQYLEVGYVGTFGRHLLDSVGANVVPEGALSAAFPDPVQRVALAPSAVAAFRPYPTLGGVGYWEYNATSNYHSLQATLGRQASGRFQYFLSYTFSKALGATSSEYASIDPFDARHRSYGILPYDRTHVANLSWNWMVPDLAHGRGALLRGLGNGWQLSGISSFSSGIPITLALGGDISSAEMKQAWFGTPDVLQGSPGSAPTATYSCDPRLGGTRHGERVLDPACVGIPAFGVTGNWVPPYYLRTPSRSTHDVTLFKNFGLGGSRKLQLRVGAFNVFNQAVATYNLGYNDIDLALTTTCNRKVAGVPNGAGGTVAVCDPQGGFSFTPQTLGNFGKIVNQRGHRIVELALKLYF